MPSADRYESERISATEPEPHGGRLFMRATEERIAAGSLDADLAQRALAEEKGLPSKRPSALARYRSLRIWMAVADATCLLTALGIAYLLRYGFTVRVDYLIVIALAPLVWLGVFHGFSLYQPQLLSAAEEFRRIISATGVGILMIILISFWSHATFSRLWVGTTFVLALTFELIVRRAWRTYVAHQRASGRLALRTLIVGTNEEAQTLMRNLQKVELGFKPLGFIDIRPGDGRVSSIGLLVDLPRLIREHAAECVFVASTDVKPPDMLAVAQAVRQEGVEVRVTANLPEILTTRVSVQQNGDVMSLSLRPVSLSGGQVVLKRAFDLIVSTLGLLFTSPLLAGVAMSIRLTSHGPVLFRQERITRAGRPFVMYKFRTMANIADVEEVDRSVPFFKLQNDPRVTRVGTFLRRWSLDELPQLMNVFRGDMSLVGPRPLPTDQVAANLDLLTPRHEVPAGMTGWWQISGRSDVSPEEALRMDLFYIENWSLSLDLYILTKTSAVMLGRRGAY